MGNSKTLGVSFIRTSLVPAVGGWLGAKLILAGISVPAPWLFAAISLLLSGVWYISFHAIEVLSTKPKVRKWAGIFLGYPVEVTYGTPSKDPIVPGDK